MLFVGERGNHLYGNRQRQKEISLEYFTEEKFFHLGKQMNILKHTIKNTPSRLSSTMGACRRSVQIPA